VRADRRGQLRGGEGNGPRRARSGRLAMRAERNSIDEIVGELKLHSWRVDR
jgi:hypothetical protein